MEVAGTTMIYDRPVTPGVENGKVVKYKAVSETPLTN